MGGRKAGGVPPAAVPTKIIDADKNTKVDTEESADEDIVRMDVAGVEAFKLNSDGILDLAKQSRCKVGRNTDQTIPNVTFTKVQWDVERWDNQNEFDSITNYRFTAAKEGLYIVQATDYWVSFADTCESIILVQINGSNKLAGRSRPSGTGSFNENVAGAVKLSANDYVEIYVYQNTGSNRDIGHTAHDVYFCITKVG